MPMKTTVKAHKKPRSHAWKYLGAAAVSAAILTQAHAVGLGQLNVLSALGQPLQAEIELTSVSRDEAGSLAVKLASPEAFRQANIEYNPALQNLRFSIEQRNGRSVVKVTSSQPISEPFVDLLLEVSSRDSRLVREYVVLLDPVGNRRIQSAETTPAPSATAPAAAAQGQNRAAPSPAASQESSGDTHTVKRGDTLAGIASQYKREGVSLDQMLVAMQRANPNAFVGSNMNRLRSGQILNVPSGEAARSVDNAEARRIVVAQSADFNNYRNRLAAQVADSASGQRDESGQIASGRIGSRVEEQKNPASESRDRLQVSRSGTAPSAADTEDRIAREKALAEANARVAELEKTVNDLQKLLEIKNRDLAARQNSATPSQSTAPAAAAGAAAGAAAAAPATPASGNPPASAAPAAGASPAATADAAAGSAPAAKPAEQADKPKPKPVAKPAPAPAPEPGLLENLGSNPTVLGGGALILALLAGLGISRSRARKKSVGAAAAIAEARQNSPLEAPLKDSSLFGAPGGQNVDTSNSVFNSNFSPSASQLDTNEVDPVAEADVYIAYGRDAQAEEILKEALRNQPDRTAVRAKLLEIYANRKDLRAFETTAAELHAMTKGQGEEWEQAAALGATLDPTNALYASARKPGDNATKDAGLAAGLAGGAVAAAALAAEDKKKPEEEFDLDALLNSTQGPMLLEPEAAPAEDEPVKEEPVAEAPPAEPEAGIESPAEDEPLSAEPEALDLPQEKDEPKDANLLDFDFDLSSFGKTPPAVPESVAAEADENLMDFDLGDADEAPKAASEHAPAHQEHADDFPSLEASLPPSPPAAESDATGPADFDLSGISLDLDAANADNAALDDVPVLGAGAPNAAEMATKLDLASAYQEIGDREGARELLEEVIKGGTADQSEKAKAMLEKLV
jgi:pilus assembly protein FimV